MVGRRVDFGVLESNRGKAPAALVEATPVKASPGGLFGRRDGGGGGGGGDDGGHEDGKSIYDAWNDDYEELA